MHDSLRKLDVEYTDLMKRSTRNTFSSNLGNYFKLLKTIEVEKPDKLDLIMIHHQSNNFDFLDAPVHKRKITEYIPKYQTGGYFSDLDKMNITNFSFSKTLEDKRARPVIYVPERQDPVVLPPPINNKKTSPIGTIGSINKFDYCPTAKLNTTRSRFMADSYLGNLAF
jgi:hypothetical protein